MRFSKSMKRQRSCLLIPLPAAKLLDGVYSNPDRHLLRAIADLQQWGSPRAGRIFVSSRKLPAAPSGRSGERISLEIPPAHGDSMTPRSRIPRGRGIEHSRTFPEPRPDVSLRMFTNHSREVTEKRGLGNEEIAVLRPNE